MQLIGIPLSLALETLSEPPTIIETAPPFPSKTRIPTWGEWRVLRVREIENRLELLVARELLGETAASP